MKGYSKLKRTTSLLMILVMVLCMMPQNLYAKVSNTGLSSTDVKQLVAMDSSDNVVALGSESDPEIAALKSPVINPDGTVTFNYIGTGSESMIVKGEFNSWTPVPMELNTTGQGNSYFSKTVQVATGAGICTYGMEDTSATDNKWKADPLNQAIAKNNGNPAIVRNPIEGSSGTTIYYPATVPGAKVYYRVAGSSDLYQSVDMTADASFKSGMYSYTFTVAGDYEYYIQDEKGSNIGDPNNFVSTSDPKTFKVAAIDPEVANLASPIVNGTQVTFNYYAPSAGTVKVAGSFTSWADKAITLTKNAKGIWTTTQTLQPGSYQYKFVVDGSSWVTDPKNSVIKDTNSAFNVDGLVVSTKVDVEKGKTATLPTIASMYTNGVSSQVTVDSYSLVNQTAG
ncbi:MAG TPA: hypothetical protein VHP81_04170, partial [Lachnospiraceae bacterium]|nr:hypothetical protein [Lachnospiraceae bacterium]